VIQRAAVRQITSMRIDIGKALPLAFAFAFSLGAACDTEQHQLGGKDNELGGGSGAGGSASGNDAETAADAAMDGRYSQGIYACCAKGENRSCCPPESLPDPSIGRTATCFAYGGVRGDCTGEGETLEAKDICSICCPGLTRLEVCDRVAPPGLFVCGACGNGECGPGESACNCPADCSSCSCASSPLFPGSSLVAGRLELDCYCRNFSCPSYEQSRNPDQCAEIPQLSVSTYSNCDLIQIEIGGGYSGTAYTYHATTHELLGVYVYSDIPSFACEERTVGALVAGIRPFPDCTLLERVNVCE
jgi:hypothetical protein